MTVLDHALDLAAQGYHVFPLGFGTKKPPKGMKFKERASRDPDAIKAMFGNRLDYDVAIYTGAEDAPLLALDIDRKKGVNGYATLLGFELEGLDLPDTREHHTHSGGRHLLFRVKQAVKPSVRKIGAGLDVRSKGSYIAASLHGKPYPIADAPLADAPEWLVARCGEARKAKEPTAAAAAPSDPESTQRRAVEYLTEAAPAIEGQGGDQKTFATAARLKDFGLTENAAADLMLETWNPRCLPPWSDDDLRQKVRNAYRYGENQAGSADPTTEFTPIAAPMTAAWLLTQEFEPVRWVIEDLLPEGLTILAGLPKLGKSWLALGWATNSATGGKVFGKYPCTAGDVLYLALEDNPRRLQSRLRTIEAPKSARLHFRTEWKRLDAGGIEDLEAWCDAHPETRLIIIDTFARVRPPRARGADPYQADADAIKPLHQLASRRKIAIVVVHHVRKMGADDFQDRISGTTGLTGVADTNMVLSRARLQGVASLELTGRDVSEAKIVLEMEEGIWTASDISPEAVSLPPGQKRVVDVLSNVPNVSPDGSMSRNQIALEIGKSGQATSNTLAALEKKGMVVPMGDGRWRLPKTPKTAADVFDE